MDFRSKLQHFDGESAKINTREIRSFLSPRNKYPRKLIPTRYAFCIAKDLGKKLPTLKSVFYWSTTFNVT